MTTCTEVTECVVWTLTAAFHALIHLFDCLVLTLPRVALLSSPSAALMRHESQCSIQLLHTPPLPETGADTLQRLTGLKQQSLEAAVLSVRQLLPLRTVLDRLFKRTGGTLENCEIICSSELHCSTAPLVLVFLLH